jgi:opacity protein-like surface antigen
MKLYFKLIIFLFIISFTKSNAQLDLSHEFGLFTGPISMQTDYGERNYFPASNQTSFGVAVVHYLSFYGNNYNWRNGASFFSDHFKLRTELSYYFNNKLEHRSDFIDNNPGALAESFRNMKGSTKIFNIGTQLEYYFKNLEDYGLLFNTADKFAPYLSAGIQYNRFDADVTTAGGGFNISSIPVKFQDDIILDPETTFSLVMGLGTRYKMDNFDLVVDGRWQYFLSDKVDGVDADKVDGSKFNDTLIFFSVGIVFNLEGQN